MVGGVVSATLIMTSSETGYRGRLRSVRAADSYVPLGPSAAAVLVNEADIVAAVREAAS